jgi:hypothetical protein
LHTTLQGQETGLGAQAGQHGIYGGRASDLKEPMVAARVFNLRSKFDRRNNSIVRAEATHVRRRLRDYYLGAGAADRVIVDLPRGGYAPAIRALARGGSTRPRWAAFLSWLRPWKETPTPRE